MPNFSHHASSKLFDLFNNHTHEVGSNLKASDPTTYNSYDSTDCITYALNVISHAFVQTGNATAAKDVWSRGKKGSDLASYLVNNHGWTGIYINPDVHHPIDSDSEHAFSHHLANKSCKYYQIPLEYKVTNYSITPASHPEFQKLSKSKPLTKLETVDIATLKLVEFAFGISRGGLHTWVYSKGKIYEVHWDKIGADLYEATPITKFSWLSGAVVVPPDQKHLLTFSSKLKCAP